MTDWQLSGDVCDGQGKGQGFTALDWVREGVIEALGIDPHAGTLNLRLSTQASRAVWQRVRSGPSLHLPGQGGACDARLFPVQLAEQLPAAIILPAVPDYPDDQLELLAAVPLRETLGLNSGDSLTVSGHSMPAIEAAIFDVDGTLVNSVDAYHIAAGRAAAEFGYGVTRDDVRAALNSQRPFWELVVTDPAHQNKETFRTLARETMRHWNAVLDEHVQLVPDVVETLDQLRAAGVRLAIYTGSRGESFAPMERAGLLDYFDIVVTSVEVKEAKPHPEGVLRCLDALGVVPARAAYIGDTAPDMGAARRAGAQAIGMLTGAGDSSVLSAAGAHRLVPHHEALAALLLGKRAG